MPSRAGRWLGSMVEMTRRNRPAQQEFRQLRLPLDEPPVRVDAEGLDRLVAATLARHEPGLELPPIRVSSRMRRTLGTFTPSKNLVSISARLLAFGTAEQQETILMHEVAHAIVHHRHNGAPAHGREFKQVCAEIGVEPARFVEVGAREWAERTRFAFTCGSCGSQGLRKRRVPMVKCECGTRQRPKQWDVVAIDPDGKSWAVIGTSRR